MNLCLGSTDDVPVSSACSQLQTSNVLTTDWKTCSFHILQEVMTAFLLLAVA